MRHIEALTAFGNPTVNSFKRIAASHTDSGATWAPSMATHGGNDRTHTIRVPDAPRLELRLGDMAMNPYLYPAAVLAAGLEGIATEVGQAPPPHPKLSPHPSSAILTECAIPSL